MYALDHALPGPLLESVGLNLADRFRLLVPVPPVRSNFAQTFSGTASPVQADAQLEPTIFGTLFGPYASDRVGPPRTGLTLEINRVTRRPPRATAPNQLEVGVRASLNEFDLVCLLSHIQKRLL
jgi:hypothetical protein